MHSTRDLPLTYLTEVRSMLAPGEGKASLKPSLGGNIFFCSGHFMGIAKLYHKRMQGQKVQKNTHGSKCLKLSNSSRNAKIAKIFKKCQMCEAHSKWPLRASNWKS